ncbi:MAG: hypothetical protein EPN37_08015 [Chitinophagaceae bacterium]|nr:MAG: hypothetical protein EPN37_08015 [Chitinophagaceae bacterium]
MIKFSATYLPTTLFSLKSSNATNSGAKSLFLPSPYAIKMAILNQAITIGGELSNLEKKKSKEFVYIRDAQIGYYLPKGIGFCTNNSFVKILKPAREGEGFQQTVAFREYLHITKELEIIFGVESEDAKIYLGRFLHKISYFGKRGCFFQFIKYSDEPSESNVKPFDPDLNVFGLIEEHDDFDSSLTFEQVNNFSSKNTKRKKEILILPLENISSSKSFSFYKLS